MEDPLNSQSEFNNLPVAVSQDSKNIALLMWLGTIFFSFIPALVIYLIKTEDRYLADQSKEALNWSITVFIATVVGWVLCIILIGFLVLFAVGILNIVFCILGVLATSDGKMFRAPFAIRLIK
ncbi:MAG: DUF4870 domain-containing protein [Gammaproteobacteria bacterium]|nr:MAG: DUF4870 domain-containing protein [Gammaproteobacteria bacterium]